MKISNLKCSSIFCFIILCPSVNCNAAINCKELHSKIFNSAGSPLDYSLLQELSKQSTNGDLCAKNILGRIFAKGIGVNADWERAYSIFTEAAEAGYPPSQLNLAILISEKTDYDLNMLLSYITGIIYTYSTSVEYASIAKSAKDLGNFILTQKIRNPEISEVDKNNYTAMLNSFQYNAADASVKATGYLLNKEAIGKSNELAVVGMISLGASVMNYRSNLSNIKSANQVKNISVNPSSSRLYYVTPMGGNMLYVMPLR